MPERFSKIEHAEDILDEFERIYQELKNVEAKGRNFSVEISGEPDNLSVIIDRKGIFLNMAYFLPEDYRFAAGERFHCNKACKKVFFPPEETKLRGFILTLLHAIGHAHQPVILEPDLGFCQAIYVFAYKFYKFMKTIIRSPEWKLRFLDKNLSYLSPDWLNKKRNDLKINEERAAWQYAYDTSHCLQERGYNVLDGYENDEQIQVFMKLSLTTHLIKSGLDQAIAKRF